MLPEVFYPIVLFAAVSCYPAAPKTEFVLLQPAQPQFLQAYTVQPKPEAADSKNQYVFFYPNQYYYLRDEETSWLQSFQNWFTQNQAQSGVNPPNPTGGAAEAENAANNAANPNPTNPEQATRIYQRFDGEESSDKGEKKLYYLVPASASASAPPQFIRQVNPFQAIPSVRPVFAAAPAAAPFDAKSAFVLQPVSLRGDFKSIEQPKAEMLAQPTFVVSPASIRAALNQPEGQQQQQQIMASGIPLQLRSGLAEEESPKPQPDQQPQQQLQQIPQNDRQLNVLQQQIGQAQVQQSQRMWNEQQQQQQQFLQQQQQQIQSQVQQNERLWSEAQLQQQQPLAQAQISERFSNEQQQQPASAQIAQSERLWNANPEDRQPEPAPQPENPPSNSSPVNAQAKSNNADSNSIAASPESFDKRDEEQKKPEDDNKQNKNEIRRADDASIAQAKPNGLSLAGAGGVASSAPHATALVGKDGLALTAPSATAVAGDFGSLGAAGILSNNGK